MSLWDNTRVVGKRAPYYTEYNVGFEDDGKLAGVTIKAYANCGASGNDSPVSGLSTWADNSKKRVLPYNVLKFNDWIFH